MPSGGMALLTVGGDSLYWTDSGKLYRLPVGGGSATALATVNESFNHIVGLAADAKSVYWTNGKEIVRNHATGGGGKVLVSGHSIGSLAVDDEAIYWIDGTDSAHEVVWKMPKGGGTATSLTPDQSGADRIAVGADSVYYLVEEQSGASDCTDLDVCYSVRRAPKAGGTVTVIASHQKTVGGVVVDDSHVYWVNQALPGFSTSQPPATIMRAPIDGGPAEALATFTAPQLEAENILSTPPPVLCPGGICWAGGGGTPPGSIWRFVACD